MKIPKDIETRFLDILYGLEAVVSYSKGIDVLITNELSNEFTDKEIESYELVKKSKDILEECNCGVVKLKGKVCGCCGGTK